MTASGPESNGERKSPSEVDSSTPDAQTALSGAPRAVQEALRQMQDDRDRMRGEFLDAIQNAEAPPDKLRKVMLFNMTTRPEVQWQAIMLGWMQRAPQDWQGYHPEKAENVAEFLGPMEGHEHEHS